MIAARLNGRTRICSSEEETLSALLVLALVASGQPGDLSAAMATVEEKQSAVG